MPARLSACSAQRVARPRPHAERSRASRPRLPASLHHPNIAAIYGFEHIDGRHLLIVAYVNGPALADRLKSGALPVDEALKVGVELEAPGERSHRA